MSELLRQPLSGYARQANFPLSSGQHHVVCVLRRNAAKAGKPTGTELRLIIFNFLIAPLLQSSAVTRHFVRVHPRCLKCSPGEFSVHHVGLATVDTWRRVILRGDPYTHHHLWWVRFNYARQSPVLESLTDLLSGVELYLFFKTLRVFLSRKRLGRRRKSDIFYAGFSVAMLILFTIWLVIGGIIAQEKWVQNSNETYLTGSHTQLEQRDTQLTTVIIIQLMTDGLMVRLG